MRQRFLDPFISEDRPVAETFPAFPGLRIGRDGRIWVRPYVRPGGPETEEWLAFDPDGRFACRATVPPVGQVLEFGEDYMLAHDPDELGVERVVLYAIGDAGSVLPDR